jgi:predicted transposase YbfD/YdcC
VIHEISSQRRQHAINDYGQRTVANEELEASTMSLRTTNPATFAENSRSRFTNEGSPGKISLQANFERENLRNRRRRAKRKQSFVSTLANELLAYADRLQDPDGMGGTVGAMYGVFGIPKYASKSASVRADIQELSKLMTVFLIEEDYTSQVFPFLFIND